MTPTARPSDADVREMARGLSEAQRCAKSLTDARKRMVLELPADGSWGSVTSRSVAKRAWWSMIHGIIDHKHCPEDKNEWCLSEFGIAVAAALRARAQGGAS